MSDPVGKLGHVGIAPEVVFGTGVGAADHLKFNSESLTLGIEELIEASLQARQDEPDSYEGLGTIAGDTVHEVHPKGIGHLLRSWYGPPLSSDRTGSHEHVFTPAVQRLVAARKGTATGGSSTTLEDTGQAWTADEYIGWWVHIVEGTGLGQVRKITDNDATTLTVATWTASDATSVYEIRPGPENCALPPYTIEVHRDLPGATPAFQFKGMVANTLAFSVGVGAKILTCTAGWLGKDVVKLASTAPSMPTTEPFRWHQLKIGIGSADTGTATGGAAGTLIDSGAGWTADEHIGRLVMKVNAAGTATEVRRITDNDDTTLTVSPNWTVAGAVTDTYEIFYCPDISETFEFTLDNGLIAVPTLNFTKRISRIMGDAFRMGTMTRTVIPQDMTDFDTYYTGWTTRRWLLWFLGPAITGNHYYEMFTLFPKVLLTAYPIGIGGGGRLTVAIAAKPKYDSTAGYLAKTWLLNNTASF